MSIAVQRLTYAYKPGATPVLADLSHEFSAGFVTAVTGPSGCGKSTLLYVLGLMLKPTSGAVLIDGEPVSALPDVHRSRIRGHDVGFVFQDAILDASRSVRENVNEGFLFTQASQATLNVTGLLARFGVDRRAGHRPGEISGGQAQRVALCRALVKQPRIVLADEPTGNLDRASAEVVWSALADTARAARATVVLATHDESLAARADRVLRLEPVT